MYYEEKLIGGVLFCRTNPEGDFKQCCIHNMSIRIVDQDKEIAGLKKMIDHGIGWADLEDDTKPF